MFMVLKLMICETDDVDEFLVLHDFSDDQHAGSDTPNLLSKCDVTELGSHDCDLHNEHFKCVGLRPINIAVPDGSFAATYKRCIELMYVPRSSINSCRPFSGVEDALSMIQVAAEFLFHDCADACMEFLEMLPSWTAREEASIQETLASLQLSHINVDLAARLSLPQGIPAHQPMNVMRSMLVHVLQSACKVLPMTPPAMKNLDSSKPIPEAMILLVWNANLDLMKTRLKMQFQNTNGTQSAKQEAETVGSNLSWFLRKLLDLEAADAVIKALVKDSQLSSVTEDLIKAHISYRYLTSFTHPALSLLDLAMEAVLNGHVLLSRTSRFTFITTWFSVAEWWASLKYDSYSNVRHGFHKLLSSLPVLDREHIYKKYKGRSVSSSFGPWCDMLRKIHLQHREGQEGLLATDDP